MSWLSLFLVLTGHPADGEPVRPDTDVAGDLAGDPQEVQGPVIHLEDVEVVGRRGAAQIPPEIEFGTDAIDALNAYDVREVIERMGRRLGKTGAPVILVNGRRIADPSIYLEFPPDALVRLEVLPADAGAAYGAQPGGTVMNVVFQPQFRSRDGFASVGRPTVGGATTLNADLRRSSISDNNTSQSGVRFNDATALRAAERPDYLQEHPGTGDVTLRPETESVNANLSFVRPLGDGTASLSAVAQSLATRSVFTADGQPIENRNDLRTLGLTGGLTGQVMGWSGQATLNGTLSATDVDGPAESSGENRSLGLNVSANRSLWTLPAGPLFANVAGQTFHSRSVVESVSGRSVFTSRNSSVGGDIRLPFSRSAASAGEDRAGVLGIGDASLGLGGRARMVDGASGADLNASLSWIPRQKLGVNGAWFRSTDTPSDMVRYAPISFGESEVVYDFRTGEAVDVVPILGGNPDLRPPVRDQFSLGVSVGPVTPWMVVGNISAQRVSTADGLGVLPFPTADVEAAFPERFQRDETGRLISMDRRPLNILAQEVATLSSNLSWSVPFAPATPDGPTGRSAQMSLTHVWRLDDTTTIREGLPEMDRLAGDGGGASRHEISAQIDARGGRWGLNGSALWKGGYRIRRESGLDSPDDLRVGALGTVNLKISYLFQRPGASETATDEPPRRSEGIQVGLEIDNLFDARPEATLGDGRPAPGYGRDDHDPLGRVIRLTVKGRF